MDEMDRIEEIMDHRLQPSSRRTVRTASDRWARYCDQQGWDERILTTGMSIRGGRLTSWVRSMVDDDKIVYKSISAYVWGLRVWHVFQHQADPVLGVNFWREFMQGVSVLTSVPGEPRKQVPLSVVDAMLDALDPDDYEQANFGLLVVVMLESFSRTECPCPKTWVGEDKFCPKYHWQVKDFKLRRGPNDQWVLWVRFKAIKQDGRLERPHAQDCQWVPFEHEDDSFGRDWVPLGDVPDSRYSVALWYKAVTRACGRVREQDEPMFLSKDKVRPYTYSCFLTDFRKWLKVVKADVTLGPHGLRILGYNLSKAANGEDLTVAHGGWLSSAHTRYERFGYSTALGITASMFGKVSVFGSEGDARTITTGRAPSRHAPAVDKTTLNAGDFLPSDSEDEGEDTEDVPHTREVDPLAPDGFLRERRVTANGCRYSVWYSGDARFESRAEAWRSVPGDGLASPATSGAPRTPTPKSRTTQCGNPKCIILSKNGMHAGLCRFADPGKRRIDPGN